MSDNQPPRSVSSSAWTGPPPETTHNTVGRGFRPRSDPAEQRTLAVAGVLLAICFLGFFGWYAVLGSRSAMAPSPETGQTQALNLFSRKAPPIYVGPAEALITCALLVAVFAVPVAYILRSEALRRRSKR